MCSSDLIQIMIGPWVQTSVYDMGCIDFHYTAVMTHTAPTGAYRGAGRPEAIYNIERLIDEACGPDVAGRLHTARSRNDLAMTMYRMWQRERIAALGSAVLDLREALIALADRHKDTIYGAHTHTQPAQPTTVAHYLLAIIEQLERDSARLLAAFDSDRKSTRLNSSH